MLKNYKIVGLSPDKAKIRFRGKDYDLNKIDDETAKFLYENKCGFIDKADTQVTASSKKDKTATDQPS
jgi:hypothetical protein